MQALSVRETGLWISLKRRTYVRLLLTQVRLFSLQELVAHFAFEYNFAGSLADLVQSKIKRQGQGTYPDLTKEVPLSLLLLLQLLKTSRFNSSLCFSSLSLDRTRDYRFALFSDQLHRSPCTQDSILSLVYSLGLPSLPVIHFRARLSFLDVWYRTRLVLMRPIHLVHLLWAVELTTVQVTLHLFPVNMMPMETNWIHIEMDLVLWTRLSTCSSSLK